MKKRAGSLRVGKRHSAGAINTRHAVTRAEAVVGDKTVRDDLSEVWRILSRGKIRSIATSPSSNAAMDEAMVIYGRALERLANR